MKPKNEAEAGIHLNTNGQPPTTLLGEMPPMFSGFLIPFQWLNEGCIDPAAKPEIMKHPYAHGWNRKPTDPIKARCYKRNIDMMLVRLRELVFGGVGISMPQIVAEIAAKISYKIDEHGRYVCALDAVSMKANGAHDINPLLTWLRKNEDKLGRWTAHAEI